MDNTEEYQQVMTNGGYKVLSKSVYRVTGDVQSLIFGLSTNVLEAPTNAFVDRQGKLIAVCDQVMMNDETLYFSVEKSYEAALLEHLRQFEPYSKAKIEPTDLKVVHLIGEHKKICDIVSPAGIGRIYFAKVIEISKDLAAISDEVYDVIRLENNLSQQGIDFDRPMFLETNMDETVSYTKGCYLGQEVIARVHNLGKPKRKLIRILYDKLPEAVTSGNEVIGKITSRCFSPKYQKYLVFAMVEKYTETIDNGKVLK